MLLAKRAAQLHRLALARAHALVLGGALRLQVGEARLECLRLLTPQPLLQRPLPHLVCRLAQLAAHRRLVRLSALQQRGRRVQALLLGVELGGAGARALAQRSKLGRLLPRQLLSRRKLRLQVRLRAIAHEPSLAHRRRQRLARGLRILAGALRVSSGELARVLVGGRLLARRLLVGLGAREPRARLAELPLLLIELLRESRARLLFGLKPNLSDAQLLAHGADDILQILRRARSLAQLRPGQPLGRSQLLGLHLFGPHLSAEVVELVAFSPGALLVDEKFLLEGLDPCRLRDRQRLVGTRHGQ